MEISSKKISPHSRLLDNLFTFKWKVSSIFAEILGLYEIHHIAITRINIENEILIFSSTPAIEFNLFSSQLWSFDNTFNPAWIMQCTHANWPSLYRKSHFEELYYLRQGKHHLFLTLSIGAKINDAYYIYSFASRSYCKNTSYLFSHPHKDLYRIGKHCAILLNPLFQIVEEKEIILP